MKNAFESYVKLRKFKQKSPESIHMGSSARIFDIWTRELHTQDSKGLFIRTTK